ncbi:MAG: diaminopimelate epimerase [Parvularculaceae bacterium]|nr:diaminopimelate epimerase [Parvularculaceae bacterium]
MSDATGQPYLKMNGLGNDFVIFDLRRSDFSLTDALARRIADRTTGIGCDQVITIEDKGGLFMGVWNADGSRSGACGNAARCVGWIVSEESGARRVELATASGPIVAERVSELVFRVDMGAPRFGWRDIPLSEEVQDTRFVDVKLGPIDKPVLWGPSAVSMGNPHCVFFVDDVDAHRLDRFGPLVENHPLFPERTNVELAKVEAKDRIRLRVWERGAGITKACGTGACAALVAANRRRLAGRRATVILDGGPLEIEWADDDHVYMTGPVELEGRGGLPRFD